MSDITMDAARGRKRRRRSGETGGVSSPRGGFYSPISLHRQPYYNFYWSRFKFCGPAVRGFPLKEHQELRSSMNTARFVVAMRRGGAQTFRRPQLLLAAYSPTVSLPAVLIIVLSAIRVALVAAAAVFKECWVTVGHPRSRLPTFPDFFLFFFCANKQPDAPSFSHL